ncbi:MAG: hypothetical protein HY820_39830 [Acidobacteria bacterium]|nr:hypothetical protein [Acidobacteriota bacterium]
MLLEFALALWFYFITLFFTVIGLPLVLRATGSRDASIGLAQIAGWSLSGYVVWLCASLHLLSARNLLVWWPVLLLAAAGCVVCLIRSGERGLLVEALHTQGTGVAVYVGFLWIRAHHGDLLSGGEKIMDMALLASAVKSDSFPFFDMWWGTLPVNYYYYGQYLIGLLANLSGVAPSLAYNLGLGLVVSMSATIGYALLRTLEVPRLLALCGTGLVLGSAGVSFTWKLLVAVVTGGPLPMWTLAVRSAPELMQEMPAYSFLAGDLHAHVIAIPYFLACLLLLAFVFRAERPAPALWALFGLLTATSILINAWNGISIALVYGIVFLRRWKDIGWWNYSLALAVGIVVLMTPFLVSFRSPASGIGFSPLYAASRGGFATYPTPLPLLMNWAFWLLVIGVCAWKLRTQVRAVMPFWVLLAAGGAALMIGVELIFLKDLYHLTTPAWFRSNTLFKFGVHSWMLLTVATVGALQQLAGGRKWLPWTIAVYASIYPMLTISQFYGLFLTPGPNSVMSLDGTATLRLRYADAMAAVDWIQANVPDRKVFVEAACDSYSLCGIVSAYSGMRNPIQWKTHEWGWRLTRDGPQATLAQIEAIENDVRNVYQTSDLALMGALLRKLQADYVVVGDVERGTYGGIDDARFGRVGQLVFDRPHMRIYRVGR